ncbi:hypothetical protein AWB81_03750 [Caballeronia arationis]|jgi:hypothetical protein|uniref:Uncharacterized protein n=1 Tax=Caballeronia arationis TaxID=1777142 RepID=A0A7Z7IF59_9BURK|nr:hypothetical protein [Caballeronia arationis]SAK77650.1 hypothetical protein AWB81_03750 [Caballeronia arationis]SOE88792.1 hypothetical protein SAMN05446927_7415 [Caballeronia arationis]
MASHPTIAWLTPGTRRLLESYAKSENMPLEEACGELVTDRLRELKVTEPPAMPEPVPAVAGPTTDENFVRAYVPRR